MAYFSPHVIYRNPDENRENSIIRYIANRVLRQDKNCLVFVTGMPGTGKSHFCLAMAEIYSKMTGIPFDPNVHILNSLKKILQLITASDVDKKIQIGTPLVVEEFQEMGNNRNWQSQMNKALSSLVSTFRNKRLVVFFNCPYSSAIDKQVRILFHADFKVLGFDKNISMTKVMPRFLEFDKNRERFLYKRLRVSYAIKGKSAYNHTKLDFWFVPHASSETIKIYEEQKKEFNDDLNLKLLKKVEEAEKKVEVKQEPDKKIDLFQVRDLYLKFGDNYFKILEKMPHLTPSTLEKYLVFVRRSLKNEENERKNEENERKGDDNT